MSVRFDHREDGTAEQAWRDAEPWRDAAPLALDAERLIVLSAHPDDETLGAGGLIATAARAGLEVSVVVVTDGEGSHPGQAAETTARLRREELVRAVARLAPHTSVLFLGVPDGGIREHRQRVADAVAAVVRLGPAGATLVAAPWWGDGHRDHRVLGEVARDLSGAGVRVVGYPIWMWHWAAPGEVDGAGWRLLRLDPDVGAAKAAAVAEHRSQLHPSAIDPDDGPMLHRNTLAHFARDVEVFVPAQGEAGAAVTDFEAFHARHADPWGLESRWYERRKRALLTAALPDERYAHALELGCASGATTAALSERAGRVTAVDSSATALARAADRGLDGVDWVRAELPEQWPAGRFDLVVLSELGYYWSPAQLALALDRIDAGATERAVLVACHWRHPVAAGAPTGDDVHAAIAARGEWTRSVRHAEDDFLLEVFLRPGAGSVAAVAGLVP